MGRPFVSRRSLAALILVLGALVACGEPVATLEPEYIRITGSTTMGPVIAELVSAFSEQNPTVSADVAAYGSQFALDSLRAGESELAMLSWLDVDPPGFRSGDGQLDPEWETFLVGRDAIAIIVHPDNPVQELGLLQVRAIFGGRVYEWSAVGGRAGQGLVQPMSREEGAGVRAAFEALAMEGLPVTPRAIVMPTGKALVDYVADHPEAIGYVSMAETSNRVRPLKIEGELPTPETSKEGSYPLSYDLWLVAANSSEPVQSFVAFARSQAGQEIIGQRFAQIK
jgi:phosphate transport system substrate-binding protein